MKRHLKAITVPKTWPIKRKGIKFVVRPFPSKKFSYSMPLSLVFKALLKYCKTNKEVKTILRDKEILVDGRRKKDIKDLLGFMDVLSIPVANENYRMLLNRFNKLSLIQIDDQESKFKIVKIIGKTTLKNGKMQLNLFDSRNILVDNNDEYKVGDSLKIELPSQKILAHYKLDKGAYVYIISGKHAGSYGVISKLDNNNFYVKSNDEEYLVNKESLYVIGKEKSEIKLIE
ncbi:MAG: 30S ribosomal protein S4e [Candidatus Woesearchaeota archaeon]